MTRTTPAPSSARAAAPAAKPSPGTQKEKFLVLPIVILILAQMGATGDNGALSLAVELLPLVAVLPQAARLTVMQPAASRAAARFMVLRFIFRSLLLL